MKRRRLVSSVVVALRLVCGLGVGLCLARIWQQQQQSSLSLSLDLSQPEPYREQQQQQPQNLTHAVPTSFNASRTTTAQTNNSKPRLIIHIGPGKTGSSTLQQELAGWTESLDHDDDWLYLGKETHTKKKPWAWLQTRLYSCDLEAARLQNQSYDSVSCWKAFQRTLKELQGRNLILSAEEMSFPMITLRFQTPAFTETFWRVLQPWQVEIVAVYRRHAEWLLSAKRQEDGVSCLQRQTDAGRQWPRRNGVGRACFNTWPRIQSYLAAGQAYTYLHVLNATKPWRNLGNVSIRILNSHDRGHLTTHFVCNVLKAPATCRRAQELEQQPRGDQNTTTTRRINARTNIDTAFDQLAVAAQQRGLLQNNVTREDATRQLAQLGLSWNQLVGVVNPPRNASSGQQPTSALRSPARLHLPWLCPRRAELDGLLNLSLSVEHHLWDEAAAHDDFTIIDVGSNDQDSSPASASQRRKQHVAAFEELIQTKAFCSLRTDWILRGKTSWQQVLDALQSLQ